MQAEAVRSDRPAPDGPSFGFETAGSAWAEAIWAAHGAPAAFPDQAASASFGSAQPLAEALDQLFCVVASLTDEQFVEAPVGPIASSIGAQIRHCLDHVSALVEGARTGTISYDRRERGTVVERDRAAALEAIARQRSALRSLAGAGMDRPVELTLLLRADTRPIATHSCIARELAFVLSHTIHHSALVATAVKLLGLEPPATLGWAPSTLAFLEGTSCAR